MKRMMLMLLTALLLTGCSRMQLEDRLLAVSMGLEKAPQGGIRMTVQVPVPGQDPEKTEDSGILLLTAEGRDWEEAMDEMEAQSPHRISFSQLRQVVVQEDLAASQGFTDLIRQVFRRHQVRANAYVVVTPDDCRTFLEALKPDVGGHLGKYLDTVMKNLIAKQYVPEAVLGLAARDLAASAGDPPLIRAQVKEGKVQYLGAALTSEGRVTGWLDGRQTQLLALLTRGARRVSLRTGEGKTAEVSALKGPKVHWDGEAIHVLLQVTAYSPVGQSPDREGVEKALVEEMTALVDHMRSMGSDGAAFGRQALWGAVDQAQAESRLRRINEARVVIEARAQMVISAN